MLTIFILASYFILATTCSFVNLEFAKKLASKPNKMDIQLYVATSLGTNYHINLIIRDYAIKVERRTLPADLVQLEIQG